MPLPFYLVTAILLTSECSAELQNLPAIYCIHYDLDVEEPTTEDHSKSLTTFSIVFKNKFDKLTDLNDLRSVFQNESQLANPPRTRDLS